VARLHLVLVEPRIAGNIGALVRLCAATGCALHVCGQLPFDPNDRRMQRAGLDYWDDAEVRFHDDVGRCLALLGRAPWVVEVGGARAPWDAELAEGDVVVFGPEDGSVDPSALGASEERRLTLPMAEGIRSLNLAQSASAVVFEAVRQGGARGA
jgi:tRNA (cytidine/uridine-2'-O-)-methyltransferase